MIIIGKGGSEVKGKHSEVYSCASLVGTDALEI